MLRGAGWSLLFLLLAQTALAEQLRVRISPANEELKANVEGYIGELEGKSREELQRLSRIASAQARQAAEALGYYRAEIETEVGGAEAKPRDRKSTRLNSSHVRISYAVFCLKKKNTRD